MLSGSGFRHDPLFAHADSQQNLAQTVVDLVGSGVVQVLTFEIDAGSPSTVFFQTPGTVQGSGSSRIFGQKFGKGRLEIGVLLGTLVFGLEFPQTGHEGFGHELAAEFAKPSGAARGPGGIP